ncbi:MAG: hypothetical protein ACTSP3_09680 [Candidatus Heimdallarchaeaceae archaeon]
MKPLLLSVKKKKELEEFLHHFQGFNEEIKNQQMERTRQPSLQFLTSLFLSRT